MPRIPKDFPVRPLKPGQTAKDRATCGECGRSWDDAIVTSYTPAPAARCPFEAWHTPQTRKEFSISLMTIDTAFEVVLELAQQNVIDARDNADEAARQQQAIDVVTDFYVNNVAD